ncbi:hypothetical protein [Desulfurispora thermophila]|uniref:hypothetical protein n=1 Tax=Desulfurispora thermophila TaxID=265470 RepID=UPI000378F91B|nr:hypothetical protein [Desulfurispora thermophila]
MTGYVLIPYLLVHSYTDIKTARTSNIVNMMALLAMIYLGRNNLKPVMLALLFCLIVGLMLEKVKVWCPGDTRMFAIAGGYMTLLGVPLWVYLVSFFGCYLALSVLLLAANGQLKINNYTLYSAFNPRLREKGIQFPGAPLISLVAMLSWGVARWILPT